MKEDFENELIEFLKIPSISAQSKHRSDCRLAADFVKKALQKRGFETEIRETGDPDSSYPVVIGKYEPPNSKKHDPTLLIYGHYDVQPAEPFELWQKPPFEPYINDGKVYARGATDNKGQHLALVCGLGLALKNNDLPLRTIFLIEGEEEIGSPNLEPFIKNNLKEFRSDCVLISDSPQLGPNQPAICYGLKGLTYFELDLIGAKRDLHSGSFGGLVLNPALALCQILNLLVDKNGKIQIPGFYDDVLPISKEERKMMEQLPYDEELVKKDLGITTFFGEKNFTPRERRFARPTYDIHGIKTGYQEEGAKTVIPSKATAKFGFRLVANQEPRKIERLLKNYLEKVIPKEVIWQLQSFHSCSSVNIDYNHPIMKPVSQAIKESFGQSPHFIREGGSIPVVSTFQNELKAIPLLIGLGLATDGAHAPNEHFTLDDFHRGIKMAAILPNFLAHYFSQI